MASRLLALTLAMWALGCGDDSRPLRDMSITTMPGADLSATPVDAASCGGTFNGFSDTTPLTFFTCSCSCTIDSFMHPDVSSLWAISRSGLSLPVWTANGLQSILQATQASPTAVVGLLSQTPAGGFYLDGDFDLAVDYSFDGMTPPGESHLILGVRLPAFAVGTEIYDVERARLADGSDVYRSQLGGVPPQDTVTTAAKGTLELTRRGLTVTAFGDGKRLGSFLAGDGPRVEIILSAALSGCSDADAGACSYSPLWTSLRLQSGTLVNEP